MKTKILNTACAIVTGLFIASTSVLAQVAPPTPAAVAPDYNSGGEVSLFLPKAAPSPNFYLDAGFIYTKTEIGDAYRGKSSTNMYGLNVAFGWRFDQYNKVQLDLGFLAGDEKDYGSGGKISYGAAPVLASYNFYVPLAKNRRCELRLSPIIGYYLVVANCDDYVYRRTGASRWLVDGTETGGAFAYGGSVGLTCHINQRFYVDFAYRFLGVGSLSIDVLDIKSQTTHSGIASFGWKF
ncbi:MAG: outer membrane beta-barrel protein [Opitutaceae bacterium]|jgi:hypothetical protein|nr:outer membrane beta-barrel protein [Opitutaceae bacterium]